MIIEQQIKAAITEALKQLFSLSLDPNDVLLQKTKKEFKGDFTLVVFSFSKIDKQSPEQTAQKIGLHLTQHNSNLIKSFNVVKGFLNLELHDAVWLHFFCEYAVQPQYGIRPVIINLPPILVEFASPNTNKPLHLGHIRNILLGYSISKIIEANGTKVYKVSITNDRGIHICKSMLAYQLFGHGESPESCSVKGDHLVGKYYVIFDKKYKEEIAELIASGNTKEEAEKNAPIMLQVQEMLRQWEAGNAEVIALWKTMNSWVYQGFDETYKSLGVSFDKVYYESETYLLGKQKVEDGLQKEVFYKKEDNSVWVDLTDQGLDEKVLMRGDGTSLYITQDIGTSITRHEEFNFDKMIYVVGNEQDYHFKVLFKILEKLKFSWASGLYHCSYGMVELPEGKMKSREGTVVDADDLITEMIQNARQTTEELGKTEGLTEVEKETLYHTVGLGALKYFLLKVDPKKKMLFNPKESIDFQGNTGPFIQYTHARIKSILRKSENLVRVQKELTFSSKEKELIRLIYDFPQIISDAANTYSPAIVANYVYELAKEFNQFYHECPILKETDVTIRNFRLNLIQVVAHVIQTSMNLLGAQVPERM